MTIDDRLRGAYERQLRDVRQQVGMDGAEDRFVPSRPSHSGRVLAVAAAILVLGGGLLGVRALRERAEITTLETDVGGAGSSPGQQEPDTRPAMEVDVPDAAVTSTTMTSTTMTSTTTPTTVTSTTMTSNRGTTGTTTPTAESLPTDTPDRGSGTVPNTVCPSGLRAELERAQLRYVGDNQGWGRLFDLVDEQDGPNYYQAWEPGYPDPVTVELELAVPVLATEIRVAQDPFTPVGGTVFITAAGQDLQIPLEGVDGWRVHMFDQPVQVERFTIMRAAIETNIMEVLVCTAPDQ